jgi:hypothetical protein
MSTGQSMMVEAKAEDLYELLTERMRPRLLAELEKAGPGQRLRVTSLPQPVMERLAESLQSGERWVVRLLAKEQAKEVWKATATKLIELRNSLHVPLLVLIPPGERTTAEDSLDIATFTELSLAHATAALADVLLARFEEPLRAAMKEALDYLRIQGQIRHTDEVVQYLLTAWKNGGDARAAGGALFVLGLVPDFELFGRKDHLTWLSRNLGACGWLAKVSQPLQARISKIPLKPNTLQPRLFALLRSRHADDVRSWAKEIATTAALADLSFEKWPFAGQTETEELRLLLDPLGLPRQKPDEVTGAAAMPVLNLQSKEPLKVAFRAIPGPSQVAAWKSFRIQILSVSGGETTVSWESNSFPKPKGKLAKIRRSIKLSELDALEEGTYYLKVDAYDDNGAVLTRPHHIGEDDSRRAENESERFLVVKGGDVDVEERDVRAIFVASLTEAWTRAASRALGEARRDVPPDRPKTRGTWAEPVGAAPKGDAHFELSGDAMAGFSVVVPALLRKIELTFLEKPGELVLSSISFTAARTPADAEIHRREPIDLGDDAPAQAFRAARRDVFEAILRHHADGLPLTEQQRAEQAGIVETVDLAAHADLVEAYARAYVDLVHAITASSGEARGSSPWRGLALLDVIEVRWQGWNGDPGRALLVAPTHPLRMLWHLRHTVECARAVSAWQAGEQKTGELRSYLDKLSRDVWPVNLPMVLFDRHRRGYVEHTPLTPFWPLYLPDRGAGQEPVDAVAARDRVLSAMEIRDRSVTMATVSPEELAKRLFDFVEEHPYTDQLCLNVLNPGDGRLIADTLRSLEHLRMEAFEGEAPGLRYSVRLLAAAGQVEDTGSELESLLDPDRQVGEYDEFTLASSNHLFPKLVFAKNSIQELLQSPERFGAHVSLLLEHFAPQSWVQSVEGFRRGAFVGGLVQEPETRLSTSGTEFGWVRGLRPSAPHGAATQEVLLRDAVAAAQRIQASHATGKAASGSDAPVVALYLDAVGQSLIRQVHDVSDWVLTVDRNLGIEYFDSPRNVRDSGYLLDFAPEYLQEDRPRVLLTTRSSIELSSLLFPMLERLGLALSPGEEPMVLETLRSLSGRLALRLSRGENQIAEVVSLLLTRWLLDRAGLLEDRLIIPLDAHRHWFASDDAHASERRADLLILRLSDPRRIVVQVVEVKHRESISGGARSALYADMREQTRSTEEVLRRKFALDLYSEPRPDALFCAKELASALAFYARRAHRYGLLSAEALGQWLSFVEGLDDGYTLDLESMGVLFERQGSGSHVDEEEPGFRVYRFGGDVASGLLAGAVVRHHERAAALSDRGGPASQAAPASAARTAEAAKLGEQCFATIREALGGSVRPSPAPPASTAASPPAPAAPEPPPPASATPQPAPLAPPSAPTQPSASAGPAKDAVAAPPEEAEVPAEAGTTAAHAAPPEVPLFDALLGATEPTPQYGLLGKCGSQKVAIDLNGCNTISLFGVQGFGKSYTLGVIAEMATREVANINVLPSPLGTVIFHYHRSDTYEPEHAAAVRPNEKKTEIDRLVREYGAAPAGLRDVVLLTPEAKVEERRRDYPDILVEPLKFGSSEIGPEGWKFLLGAHGNDSLYVRQLVAIMRRHRGRLTVQKLRDEIREADLGKTGLKLAEDRLALAEPYIDDSKKLGELLRPGRTVIVDLRDEWIEKDEALGLFVVMLRIFGGTMFEGKKFNKLVVFDEAHKYITESELIGEVVETIREMRHQATTVVIASQDPLSVPRPVIELTSILVLHRMTSPQWIKHLKSAILSLEDLDERPLAALAPGEALVWTQRSTDKRFMLKPQKVTIRPRFTQHGGGTKTAVAGKTVR